MGTFLKIIAAIYFGAIWLLALIAVAEYFRLIYLGGISFALRNVGEWYLPIILLTAATFSIPAAALYAFGQIVTDVRKMRGHLGAMRAYYEPDRS